MKNATDHALSIQQLNEAYTEWMQKTNTQLAAIVAHLQQLQDAIDIIDKTLDDDCDEDTAPYALVALPEE